MKLVTGFFPLLICTFVMFLNQPTVLGTTTPSPDDCPDIGTLRYEAAKYIAEFFQNQTDAIRAYVQHAVQDKRNAKRALTACYAEIESAKSLKAARISEAARLAKQLQRLEGEKAAAHSAYQQALKAFNQAKPPHVASAADAARARQEADAALRLANERSREAAALWAEANAAQQSTKWVPATNVKPGAPGNRHDNHRQTAITYHAPATAPGAGNVHVHAKVAPDASKLTERAKAAEYAAAVAQAEAERLSNIARGAEKAARSTWDNMTPNVRAYHEADARYNAITLEYSHKKATYDAAVLSVNDATNVIFAKEAEIKDAKARIEHAEAKIAEYKKQLANVQVVANYAAGVAEFIKDETYASTTAPTTDSTVTPVTDTSTTDAPDTEAANGLDGLNRLSPRLVLLIRRTLQQARSRQSVPGTGTPQTRNENRRQSVPGGNNNRTIQQLIDRITVARAPTRTANGARTANRSPGINPALIQAMMSRARQSNGRARNRAPTGGGSS